MLPARQFYVGDRVKLIKGRFAGVEGKVVSKKPFRGEWARQIKVELFRNSIGDMDKGSRELLRVKMFSWQGASSWERID
jgi:hypothetical protein